MPQKIQNGLLLYLAINCFYLLPGAILFYLSRGDPPFVPRFILAIYFVSLILFYAIRLTYAHIFLCAAFIPLSILQFAKDKKKLLFILSLLIAAVDIFLNICWEQTGQWIVRQ